MSKVIVRIRGGLGNQLFCYAAARRLAYVNKAELVIDDVTGFVRDRVYRRQYMLDHFMIPARKATPSERKEPFERYRRGLAKFISRKKPFDKRKYVEQEGIEFDQRLLEFRFAGNVYLDGLWQSEGYFKDVEQTIRQDLRIISPQDARNLQMADQIRNSQSVALHVRWFDAPGNDTPHNMSTDYYNRAIAALDERVGSPHYFLFSDNAEAARAKLSLPEERVTTVSHNQGDENAFADLWLMTQCQHVITANSTFSWWGGWLADHKNKIVIAPSERVTGITSSGFQGLIPDSWLCLYSELDFSLM